MAEKTGSTFKVPLTSILQVLPHGNAERLEIAVVYGFQVIVQKGRFKTGDEAFYIPVDSILPQSLEDVLFPADSKVKLTKHRVRQIKLRGVASQGMLVTKEEVGCPPDGGHLEQDYAPFFGISKFEPPQREIQNPGVPGKKAKHKENPHFSRYGGLDNIKWFPTKFKAEEQVVLQEKIHGSNARAGVLPYSADTLMKKIKKFLGLSPATEFCYGSNNMQLQNRPGHKGFYGEDVWGKVFSKLDAKNKLKVGETIFGEIYGEGVQKNYSYGTQEKKFVLFDVRVMQADGTHRWLNPDEVLAFAKERGFDMVPELYRGPFQSLDFVKTFAKGDSVFVPTQKVREGVVVKSLESYDENGNNRALKVISEDYLADDTNTDFN